MISLNLILKTTIAILFAVYFVVVVVFNTKNNLSVQGHLLVANTLLFVIAMSIIDTLK